MVKTNVMRTGVTDFWVADATYDQEAGKVTYGTPRVIGGTASVAVSQTKGENKVYESNVMIRNNSRVSGVNINYKSRTVDMAEEMKILHKLNAATDGDYEDGPDDIPANVAVGWAASLSNGGYKCVWYYWCTGSKGDESYDTATDSETTPEDSYDFAAMPSPVPAADGKYKMRRRKICKDETEMKAFFASVWKDEDPVAQTTGEE